MKVGDIQQKMMKFAGNTRFFVIIILVVIFLIEVDCDKETETSDKFNVKGFPTIKMMKGNQLIEYDAKPSKATLHEFVRTSLE